MNLRLYAGQACWVLVPEFLLPPSPTALYAPLIFQGFVSSDDIDAGELDYIRHALAQDLYAIIPECQVHRLWRHAQVHVDAATAGFIEPRIVQNPMGDVPEQE